MPHLLRSSPGQNPRRQRLEPGANGLLRWDIAIGFSRSQSSPNLTCRLYRGITLISIRRPCDPSDFVEATPEYKGGWGPALSYTPTPWKRRALALEFEAAASIQKDADWSQYILNVDSAVALRYVLLFTKNGWLLRLGKTSSQSRLVNGGSHRHMFSVDEQAYSEQHGHKVRSGYIHGIDDSEILIGGT